MEAQTLQDLFEWFVSKVWCRYGPVVGVLTALIGITALLGMVYLILRVFT